MINNVESVRNEDVRKSPHQVPADQFFVSMLGRVVDCSSPADAGIIAELHATFASTDLGRIPTKQLEQLILELVPPHLESAANALRARASELRRLSVE